jgi:type IV pilus assembly protein PilF
MSKPMHDLRCVSLRLCLAGVAAALLLSACTTGSKKSVSNAQNAAIANTQLGSAYMNQGNLALAKDKLDRALAQDPSNPEVHSVRGMLFDKMGMPKDADAEFRTALRLAPKDPNVINNYAVFLCQRGRTDEGVKLFEEAATNALYSTPEAAYTNAGVCLRSAKRDDQARAQFVKALQIKPSFVDAVVQLSELDMQHNNLAQARGLIDAYLANFGDNPDLLLLGVRVARAQKDQIGAQRYARKLQMNYPGTDQQKALAGLDHTG